MFLVVRDSVLTAGIVSKCLIISNKCFSRSCYCMAIQVARFFKYCCGFQRWVKLNRDFTYIKIRGRITVFEVNEELCYLFNLFLVYLT